MATDHLADIKQDVFWQLDPDKPKPTEPLTSDVSADLVVVGGGFTGLWTALLAKERWPERSVVLLEAGACGDGASGRNGGFIDYTLTHGFPNGRDRWPEEIDLLDRLGLDNLKDIGRTIKRYGIDCRWILAGELLCASNEAQAAELKADVEEQAARGHKVVYLDAEGLKKLVDSPAYIGALLEKNIALVEPARLVWGLRKACLDLGVQVYEGTTVTEITAHGGGAHGPDGHVHVITQTQDGRYGVATAPRVALGTNAYPPLLRKLKRKVVPVYDYALVTKPLKPAQLKRVNWTSQVGVNDASTAFVYARKTRDNRILWGGYDAVYFYGSRTGVKQENRTVTFEQLIARFRQRFPQLHDVEFEYRWSGVIDTSMRYSPLFGTEFDGKVAYALGYTGLGLGSTRFGANVMLDLLAGLDTERTRLRMVRETSRSFPVEPFRWIGITLTRKAILREERTGRRGLWLRFMDRLGLGFEA